MTPDVSVIVPAYNVEAYIGRAVASALAQIGASVEVIAIDDGSTDRTASILSDMAASEDRLRVVSHGNAGPSISRNVGIALAKGRYIGFLDGDDLWESGKASRHVAMMDARRELDVTYSWWKVIDERGVFSGRANTRPLESLPAGPGFEGLLVENFTGTASTLVCRRKAVEAVGGFDPALRSNVDLDLLLRITLLRDGNLTLVPEILTSYRMHSTQITSDWRRMQGNWEKVLEKMRDVAPVRVASVEALARARACRYFAYIAYTRGDYAAARRLALRAWRGAPLSMACDRRARLTTLAIVATLLPASVHDAIKGRAIDRQRRGSAAR